MIQIRLNHLPINHAHEKETLDIDEIANQFINVITVKKNTS